MKVSEAVKSYQTFQESRGDSPSHRKESGRILHSFAAAYGDPELVEVSSEIIQEFLLNVRRRPGKRGKANVSDFTVFAYYRTLAAFFNHLQRQGTLNANPMKNVPKPRIGTYLIRPFTPDQIKRILAQPDVSTFTGLRDMALMCFLLDTGCRVSECLSLTLTDLDLKQRTARVMGKGNKERIVPFGESTAEWLTYYLEQRKKSRQSDRVLVNDFGELLTRYTVCHRIEAYGTKAGVEGVRVSPHMFRHTFAVSWLKGQENYKGDTVSLQTILGHHSPEMTRRYVYLASQDLRALHDRLSPVDHMAEPPPSPGRRRIR